MTLKTFLLVCAASCLLWGFLLPVAWPGSPLTAWLFTIGLLGIGYLLGDMLREMLHPNDDPE